MILLNPCRGLPRRPYRSGTEREFDLMLEARRQSGVAPHVLAYVRRDDESFYAALDARKDDQTLEGLIRQRRLTREFIRATFQDTEGRNIRAYHTYRVPLSFARRLEIHLRAHILEILGDSDKRP